ncbi:hypothetical protein FRACYDRAFT_236134 [Fragilariopsis cylindrus CCMP1102]|uniref:Uncharacterized protein n=1 Tax=Fragilariopsis cylindrus CCMP1102 TaxID=635003 RepID=A0A1E7FPJ4_9STRA|nr:hypothetical protein FRACYDRAFT_236134 [Fragilariopsis cylindrus CCMP1102]|eukprot:OEU20066.1 hypothetical protein FRACYDRAFT_236134 [Fragilariopsis cylindrus CCMP1102]
MPRRQNKSKKKRLRRGSIEKEEEECNNGHHQPLSLEEDLRRQRIRQQERQKLEDERDKTNDDSDDDETDDNHDVGFVMPLQSSTSTSILTTRSQLILNNNGETMIRLPSMSFVLSQIIQSDPRLSIQKRNTLRQLWPTQYHFENMIINPKAAAFYCKKKWLMKHTLPDNSTMCSWDLSCKYRLHTSARTFDVAMLSNTNTDTYTGINTTNATATNSLSNTQQPHLPTVATIFHDGWGLFHHKKSHHDHRIQTIQSPPVHAIRIHENSGLCGTIVRNYNSSSSNNNNNNNNSYLFRWYKLPYATSYVEADLQHPVTDFCFGNEIAIFSCPRYRNGNNLNPLFLPLVEAGGDYNSNNNYISSTVRTINVQNFPQSDALRVEMMCKEQEKIVAFGHRNGQVSILDLRVSGTVCSILQYEESSEKSIIHNNDNNNSGGGGGGVARVSLGCVSDLGFLTRYQSGHQVIVKRSFGSCQLHDLRKSSSSMSSLSSSTTAMNSSNNTSTSIVRNMTIPSNEINPTLSANCNGFAVDNTNNDHNQTTTMISPYINSNSDACLGVFSLSTGLLVGSRVLQKRAHEDDTLYAEVCQRTTPSPSSPSPSTMYNNLSSTRNDGDDDDDKKNSVNTSKGASSSFGVWLKCGAFTRGKYDVLASSTSIEKPWTKETSYLVERLRL